MCVFHSCLKYGVLLSQPDIMLYKFVNNTTRAHAPEKSSYFKYVLLVVELDKDAVCFFEKPY